MPDRRERVTISSKSSDKQLTFFLKCCGQNINTARRQFRMLRYFLEGFAVYGIEFRHDDHGYLTLAELPSFHFWRGWR